MARDRVPGEWPPVTSAYRPADYVEEPDESQSEARNRGNFGTIEYNPRWRNYGHFKVVIATAGLPVTIRDKNFGLSRILITGAGPVSFIDCNLARARWRAPDGAVVTFTRCNVFSLAGDV